LDEEAAVTWKFQKEERIVNRNLKGNPTIFICLPSYALQRLIPVQDKSKKKSKTTHPSFPASRPPPFQSMPFQSNNPVLPKNVPSSMDKLRLISLPFKLSWIPIPPDPEESRSLSPDTPWGCKKQQLRTQNFHKWVLGLSQPCLAWRSRVFERLVLRFRGVEDVMRVFWA
jgi:hypothetical protein